MLATVQALVAICLAGRTFGSGSAAWAFGLLGFGPPSFSQQLSAFAFCCSSVRRFSPESLGIGAGPSCLSAKPIEAIVFAQVEPSAGG